MNNDRNHEFDKYIDPILSNEDIWASAARFEDVREQLRVDLYKAGHEPDFIIAVLMELMKRRQSLYNDYLTNCIKLT